MGLDLTQFAFDRSNAMPALYSKWNFSVKDITRFAADRFFLRTSGLQLFLIVLKHIESVIFAVLLKELEVVTLLYYFAL